MRLQIEADLDYAFFQPTDILLAIEAAPQTDQLLVHDTLTITGAGPLSTIPGGSGIGRRTWARIAAGTMHATYRATVDVARPVGTLVGLGRSPLAQLPAEVVPFLWPSRYCEADRLTSFACHEFQGLDGGDLILAMVDWVRGHIRYRMGSSDVTTTACDTFVSRQGVCRDFAHLMAALARARDIPARLVSVYAWRLEPEDFHAVIEVWLDGAWHIVDATGLAPLEGMVRMAVGRDATDIAFMTAFGNAQINMQSVRVSRID